MRLRLGQLDPRVRKVIPHDPLPRSTPKYRPPRIRGNPPADIFNLLALPTWSVRSLLPREQPASKKEKSEAKLEAKLGSNETDAVADDEITPAKLHHLLRLSALEPPSTKAEEAKLLKSLRSHLHFVRAIQSVDTTGVEPLVTIRDESAAAITEQTITLETLKPFLDLEEKVGINGTVRRGTNGNVDLTDGSNRRREMKKWWVDPWRLGSGREERRRGNYLIVRRHPKQSSEESKSKTGDFQALSKAPKQANDELSENV